MVDTPYKRFATLIFVLFTIAAPGGCVTHTADAQPKLPPVDQKTVQLLEAQTDALLRDIAIGNLEKVRSYFPPDREVDVLKQLELHLHGPPTRLRVSRWDAQRIAVHLSPDRRRAETVALAQVSEEEGEPTARLLQFSWAATEPSGEKFYLVPLAPASQRR